LGKEVKVSVEIKGFACKPILQVRPSVRARQVNRSLTIIGEVAMVFGVDSEWSFEK